MFRCSEPDSLLGITNRTNGETSPDGSSTSSDEDDADFADVLTSLDSRLHRLYEAFPPRTAFIVFTGHSDPRRMAELNARKSAFETAIRSGRNSEDLGDVRWTGADARALEEEVERAKRGLLFLAIKDAK